MVDSSKEGDNAHYRLRGISPRLISNKKSYDNPASASDTQFLSQVLLSWSNSPDVRPYDKTLKANHKGE